MDLWAYSPATQQWTWMSGSKTVNSIGIYGTLRSGAGSNAPGARGGAVSWTDGAGNLWLFGGSGYDSLGQSSGDPHAGTELNDLWMYNPTTQQWSWMSGSNTIDASTILGSHGVAAVDNIPPARVSMASWTDQLGNFWVFGGIGVGAELNDLWMFSPATRQWTWTSGSELPKCCTNPIVGVYGTENVAAATRAGSAAWTDDAGNHWLYGGGSLNAYSDLWRF